MSGSVYVYRISQFHDYQNQRGYLYEYPEEWQAVSWAATDHTDNMLVVSRTVARGVTEPDTVICVLRDGKRVWPL